VEYCVRDGGLGSWLFDYLKEPEILVQRADACERIGRDNSLSFFSEVQAPRTKAVALIRQGQLAEGIAELTKYIDPPMTTLDMRPYMLTILAEASAASGALQRALDLIEEAIKQVEVFEWRGHAHHAGSLRVKGWILHKMHRYEEAHAQYLAAISFAREQQARSWELRASTSAARLLAEQDRHEEARRLLSPVYSWFTEGFATTDLREARACLARLQR
jgi:predicted ATPase